jgi:hypothetical protein
VRDAVVQRCRPVQLVSQLRGVDQEAQQVQATSSTTISTRDGPHRGAVSAWRRGVSTDTLDGDLAAGATLAAQGFVDCAITDSTLADLIIHKTRSTAY